MQIIEQVYVGSIPACLPHIVDYFGGGLIVSPNGFQYGREGSLVSSRTTSRRPPLPILRPKKLRDRVLFECHVNGVSKGWQTISQDEDTEICKLNVSGRF